MNEQHRRIEGVCRRLVSGRIGRIIPLRRHPSSVVEQRFRKAQVVGSNPMGGFIAADNRQIVNYEYPPHFDPLPDYQRISRYTFASAAAVRGRRRSALTNGVLPS